MKTIKQIINSIPEFHEIFDSQESVFKEFNKTKDDSIKILFAWYGYENYSGDAYVMFERGGKLYEIYGGHCSCYGLEDQWEEGDEEEVVIKQLKKFIIENDYHGYEEKLSKFLEL